MGALARLTRLPSASDWLLALIAFACFAPFACFFGLGSRLFGWSPSADGLWQVALVALFLPALLEELIFRGPLLYTRRRPFAAGAVSLALFIAWHPLAALAFRPDAVPLFTDIRFLTIVAGLGLATTLVTVFTRSLVPAIAIHWLTVVLWKALFGGPAFLSD